MITTDRHEVLTWATTANRIRMDKLAITILSNPRRATTPDLFTDIPSRTWVRATNTWAIRLLLASTPAAVTTTKI